jgi:hypothetical protein
MRHAPRLATLALLGAACQDAATEPGQPRRVADAAPSGIPVSATRGSWDYTANLLRDISVAAAGDSVVFTYVSDAGCGLRYEAVAGIADGTLVVTDVGRAPEGVDGCLAIAYPGGIPVRLAVRAPARGRLAVALRERRESVPAGGGFVERDVLRRTVTLR